MRRGRLSDLFVGVVTKRLTLVETITKKSNQHEFQGVKPFRDLLGLEDRRRIPSRFIWIAGEQEAISDDGFMSWSNVRKDKPRAPEYHLYYNGNSVTGLMEPGDILFLALRPDDSLLAIIVPSGSTIQSQLLWLFGLDHQPELAFAPVRNAEVDFATRYILEELGIEPEEPEVDEIDPLIEGFGSVFPSTRILSDAARKSLTSISITDDPDAALLAWMDREEQMFRRLERLIVGDRIKEGFVNETGADVDSFIAVSLSIQNRRKSRVGLALENHLEAIFKAYDLRFDRGKMTENKSKPDFLFPGVANYADTAFPADRLTMLGSKSTSKDRWRQVLSEADRISPKHLVTLEPGISQNQTEEMQARHLQLVIPARLHETYQPAQRNWLMTMRDFIGLVRHRQRA